MTRVIIDNLGYQGKLIHFLDETSRRILSSIVGQGKTISQISRETGLYEQLVNYYLNKKLKNFVLREKVNGKTIYQAFKAYVDVISSEPDFYIKSFSGIEKGIAPFIIDRMLNSIIVVGSPDPHGPFSARSRDSHYVGFLMTTLSKLFDSYKHDNYIRLDTDVISERLFKENLIVLGGPVTNMITYRLNTSMKVRFLQGFNWDIYSEFSKKRYSEETIGVISLFQNPWAESKKILLFAGKRAIGTKLSIKYFTENIDSLDFSREFYLIISGIDEDGDGKPDRIVLLEENHL